MSDLWGREDLFATARRNPAPAPPSDFGESLRSAWTITREQGLSLSAEIQLFDAYDSYLDEIAELTGERPPNPMHTPRDMRGPVIAHVQRELRRLKDKHPDLEVRTPEDIAGEVARLRQAQRERRAEVARREFGLAANLGAFVGTAGAIMTDPPVLASMAFGAPAATGILRAALIEAAAAAGGEVLAQSGIQLGRRQFGEEADLGEAALAVATAGAGAGVMAPVVRGGVAGVRALTTAGQEAAEQDGPCEGR